METKIIVIYAALSSLYLSYMLFRPVIDKVSKKAVIWIPGIIAIELVIFYNIIGMCIYDPSMQEMITKRKSFFGYKQSDISGIFFKPERVFIAIGDITDVPGVKGLRALRVKMVENNRTFIYHVYVLDPKKKIKYKQEVKIVGVADDHLPSFYETTTLFLEK